VQLFDELAADLHSAWLGRQSDEGAFAELAEQALQRVSPASRVTLDDVFGWLARTDQLPAQFDPQSGFGNFSLTVAARDGFHIDLLVWTDSTTAIHQHAFHGAFQVLSGSSLQTIWSFEETGRWSDRLMRGRLTPQHSELLRKGDARRISPGPAMIHSLFHLRAPTVTVVVRTPSAATRSPPLCYERSGLAFDPYVGIGRAEKLVQMLRIVWLSEHPQRIALSQTALGGVNAHVAARIVFALGSLAPAAQQPLIDILAAHDPELAALLGATVASRARARQLVGVRKKTRSPRHRLFLALALNLPDRASIDAALRQIAPDESPDDWLWTTIASMRDGMLGVDLNEISEEILESLIRGKSVDDVSAAIGEPCGMEDDVRTLCSTLSALPVLGAVLGTRAAQH
jgi:hypothetical protein